VNLHHSRPRKGWGSSMLMEKNIRRILILFNHHWIFFHLLKNYIIFHDLKPFVVIQNTKLKQLNSPLEF
jgi:hypothetical protein